MVERVARAIGERLFGYYEPLEEGDSSPSAQARLAARTAIAAMRAPTESMLKTGSNPGLGNLYTRWTAMIDYVLAEDRP